MASALALSRSFYSWVTKIGLKENSLQESLPQVYSTNPKMLSSISENVYQTLVGTEYESRALYWRNLFENFRDDQYLEEGIRDLMDKISKALVFVYGTKPKPPVDPPKRVIVKKLQSIVVQILTFLIKVKERGKYTVFSKTEKHNWVHQLMTDIHEKQHDNEISKLHGDLFDQTDSIFNKTKWFLFTLIWPFAYGQHVQIPTIIIGQGTEVAEFFLGLLGASIDKVLGHEAKEEIINGAVEELENAVQ